MVYDGAELAEVWCQKRSSEEGVSYWSYLLYTEYDQVWREIGRVVEELICEVGGRRESAAAVEGGDVGG